MRSTQTGDGMGQVHKQVMAWDRFGRALVWKDFSFTFSALHVSVTEVEMDIMGLAFMWAVVVIRSPVILTIIEILPAPALPPPLPRLSVSV